ncbi:MAG: hypothetical protein CMA10_04625 [Euryarchaeota archaeon]|nr:hypothetical protein [Euryarchaeota archaeon]
MGIIPKWTPMAKLEQKNGKFEYRLERRKRIWRLWVRFPSIVPKRKKNTQRYCGLTEKAPDFYPLYSSQGPNSKF